MIAACIVESHVFCLHGKRKDWCKMVIKATGAASNEYAASRKAEQNGAENKNGKVVNGVVFGGNLKQKLDPVSAKKAQAQKKAMKMWSDAAGAQQKIDKDLESRASHIEDLRKEINTLNDSITQISAKQEELKEQYGITDADAQDLELLKKAGSKTPVNLTEEEKARAEQLKGQKIGEYYERYSALEDSKGRFTTDMEKKQSELVAESKAITAIQNGRLKDHSMIDAQNKKDEMMVRASKEAAFGMMLEVKDKIDDHQEELEEEEKEKAEEKKEEEERLEAIRDKNDEKEDDDDEILDIVHTDEILQLGDATDSVKQNVKKMINEMNLLVEDLKGSAVDKQL